MLEKYKGKKHSLQTNKKKLPINEFTFEQVDEFNKIYKYCKKNFLRVESTPSGGIPCDGKWKWHERFCVNKNNQRFEIVVSSCEGDYRFIIKARKHIVNTISGTRAVREIFKKADELNIDLTPYMLSKKDGLEMKKSILPPHIEVIRPEDIGKVLTHVYHMDFKSSYASRIVEAIPELYPLYDFMYKQRKFRNEYYKHVLTNSIGCFQSTFCPDYLIRRHTSPYQFAYLSKIAINNTRALVDSYITKLYESGFIPLLSNTDGIWYQSPNGWAFKDENEGTQLCNWENDHINCSFLMLSAGIYQYIEKGKCTTVLRGTSNIDSIEPDRTKWKFGDIIRFENINTFVFDEVKGVTRK